MLNILRISKKYLDCTRFFFFQKTFILLSLLQRFKILALEQITVVNLTLK